MASPTPLLATDDPLPGYAGLAGRFDECRAPDGSLRPVWAEFLRRLGPDPSATLRAASEACNRAVLEQDVSMNVYAGARSEPKPWPLDVVPQLVGAEDWAVLSDGLRQRARLFNTLLADLYGPQKFLRNRILPARLAMANPRFLRPCSGLGNLPGVFLHHYAVDIARSPDGRWWVLQDRMDAPSGLGYSLQNRFLVHTTLPQEFHGMQAQPISPFLHDFGSSLAQLAPAPGRGEETRVVFLTPGPANETYYEHAYLARFLGYPLVEGADLTTRDRQVYLRTVGGLKPVSAIVRRVDSGFCDPLELNSESVLGVPGLVHASHGGRVAIANRLGGAALESASFLAFLKPLCQSVLGEALRLPSVATWWCGQKAAREYVLENLQSLVIKPAFRERGASTTRYGALLNDSERDALAANIRARPGDFCGQERLLLGTTPALSGGALRPVPFVMRLFVAWHDGEYRVMPGGLTRFDPTGADAIVSLQKGGATKDTWVISTGSPYEPPPVPHVESGINYHRMESTPSRLADNLYWLGRYLERTAQMARLLDRLDPLLREEISALDPLVTRDSLRFLLAAQQSEAEDDATIGELATQIRLQADDPDHPGSLAANLAQLIRVLDQVKVNLPPEFWRILRKLRSIAAQGQPQLDSDFGQQLAALEALTTETLAHDTGWRFLQLGRRLERARHLVFLANEFLL
ncbi:MAG TPA: circularly permuted type 2 ATP-grasp protein, partial [Opitutaceae bacterium]